MLASDLLRACHTVAASAGAACHSTLGSRISHVLEAMGVEEAWALGTLRLTCGRDTTLEEADRAASALAEAARDLGFKYRTQD